MLQPSGVRIRNRGDRQSARVRSGRARPSLLSTSSSSAPIINAPPNRYRPLHTVAFAVARIQRGRIFEFLSSPQTVVRMAKRGRKPIEFADRVRTRMWAAQLQLLLGVDSGRALDKVFNGDRYRHSGGELVRTNQFQGYLRGTHVPRDLPSSVPTVELVEQRVPGSAAIFRSPLWNIVKHKAVNRSDIIASLASLDYPLAKAFTWRSPQTGNLQLKPLDDDLFSILNELEGYEILFANVLFIYIASINGDADLREYLVHIYHMQRYRHVHGSMLSRFYPDLYYLTDQVCKPRWYNNYGEVIEIDYPWTAQFRTIKENVAHFRMFRKVLDND